MADASQAATSTITITLADGEARETERDPFGSYACPFCSGVTPSPEGWEAGEASLVRYHAEEGRTYQPRPYPDRDVQAYQAGGCANPACLVNMNAEQLSAWRQRQAEQQAERKERERLSAWIAESQRRARQERAADWERLSAQAKAAGQCLECLRVSYRKGRPKLVRHRDPANCPVTRKYADPAASGPANSQAPANARRQLHGEWAGAVHTQVAAQAGEALPAEAGNDQAAHEPGEQCGEQVSAAAPGVPDDQGYGDCDLCLQRLGPADRFHRHDWCAAVEKADNERWQFRDDRDLEVVEREARERGRCPHQIAPGGWEASAVYCGQLILGAGSDDWCPEHQCEADGGEDGAAREYHARITRLLNDPVTADLARRNEDVRHAKREMDDEAQRVRLRQPAGEIAGDSPYTAALNVAGEFEQHAQQVGLAGERVEAQLTADGFDRDQKLMTCVRGMREELRVAAEEAANMRRALITGHSAGAKYHSTGRDAASSGTRSSS